MNTLFDLSTGDIKTQNANYVVLTCLTCDHRERHQCGGSIIQYCGVRKSNRTENGLLKIKCKTPSCHLYKKME